MGENCDKCLEGLLQGTKNPTKCFNCSDGEILNENDQCVCVTGTVRINGICVGKNLG